jgi:hypothetical protein
MVFVAPIRFSFRVKTLEEIVVQVKDKKMAESLRDVLAALDFVTSAKLKHVPISPKRRRKDASDSFFALAGIGADREISLTSQRSRAWPRQVS